LRHLTELSVKQETTHPRFTNANTINKGSMKDKQQDGSVISFIRTNFKQKIRELHIIQETITKCEDYRYNLYKNLYMEQDFKLILRKNKKDETGEAFDG